jgi:formyl-CoA transferase
VQHLDELDAAIASETSRVDKYSLCERLVSARVPCAPVRELAEVIDDPHLHETGMLSWYEHPEHGRILIHRSPLVFKGEERVEYQPSRKLGQDTRALLHELCGLDEERIAALERRGAFAPVEE